MSKPKNKIMVKWSSNFAYAIGLLTTDGNLSSDGRHFDFTSIDLEQLKNFKKCLGIKNKIGYKKSGETNRKIQRLQFGDVNFYKFLLGLGLMPAKSKTLSDLDIPDKYFFDFLRGHFDGDGTFYSYWDPRWKSSFMFYTVFLSASKQHVLWLQKKLADILKIKGHVTKSVNSSVYNLKYAKKESLRILPKIYYEPRLVKLTRKYLKIKQCLRTISKGDLI
ncbi:MAG: hypothetical protein AAB885_03195 [Patescibacteria group bacterium]